MKCKHFGECGSCTIYSTDYQTQVKNKKELVLDLISPYYNKELICFESSETNYRARAEFRIWHTGDRCDYAMGNLSKNGAVIIEMCPKVIKPIEDRMWKLLDEVNNNPILLGHKLFGIEFLATTTNECLVTMLYHRKLDEEWIKIAKELETKLNINLLGRSRKQKLIISNEFVLETLFIDGQDVYYKEYESGFTQPNPEVNIKMIEWVISNIKNISSPKNDFLESYCGLGNFTIPISKYFNKVLATEVSKKSIKSAKENCELNKIHNISFIRLSSEEMTQALNKEREFTRLKDINLDDFNFSTVLVDPPRAGLDNATIDLISNINYIIYISCNPETLARDLEDISKTHNIVNTVIFDQFPHTKHIESGVFLKKIDKI
ncbi:tRNA (uracil(54)-C5)-methyltransferase [hydrothermal vent metagenome]|uniref:tRNA (Uracil(54)-C5)-methyltransferase n=1 Tax=hydrothermal vent metagenome TaxID=652676 RepID=A0A1W1BM81_9ZZZZ